MKTEIHISDAITDPERAVLSLRKNNDHYFFPGTVDHFQAEAEARKISQFLDMAEIVDNRDSEYEVVEMEA